MKNSRRYCLALDLKDDPVLIAEYKRYHEKIWPEIEKSIREAGIENMEIYLLGNRLFMIMGTSEKFSLRRNLRQTWRIPKCRSGSG